MHPLEANLDPLDYLPLLRTYVEVDKLYYLDMPFTLGKVRITHMATGLYVIYGANAVALNEDSYKEHIGVDESLHMTVPRGMLRVKLSDYVFRALPLHTDVENIGICKHWAMRPVYKESGVLGYNLEQVSPQLVNSMREAQYDLLWKNITR